MRFTELHQWVEEIQPGVFKVGLSSFAIKELGEVVFIDFLKACGDSVKSGEPMAEVESLKSVNYFQAPFDAQIKEINSSLQNDVSAVNKDSEDSGWLFVVNAAENAALNLMDEQSYRKFAVAT